MSKVKISAGVCDGCGALIRGTLNETRHTKFHEQIDELIDWARHIGNLLSTPSLLEEALVEMAEKKEPGKPLGPNPGLLIGGFNEGA